MPHYFLAASMLALGILCFLPFIFPFMQAGCKFLVFAHHQPMIDAIHAFLIVRKFDRTNLKVAFCFNSAYQSLSLFLFWQKKKVGCIRIDGATPSSSRQALVNDFQENDSIKAAVVWFILKYNEYAFFLVLFLSFFSC